MDAQKQYATSLIWLTCEHHLEHTRLMLNTDFVLTPAGQRAIILELISSRKKTKEISDSVFYIISFDRRRSFFGADFRRCWRRTILCHIFRARCCVIRNDCTIYQTGHGKCDSGNEIATTREREKKNAHSNFKYMERGQWTLWSTYSIRYAFRRETAKWHA